MVGLQNEEASYEMNSMEFNLTSEDDEAAALLVDEHNHLRIFLVHVLVSTVQAHKVLIVNCIQTLTLVY